MVCFRNISVDTLHKGDTDDIIIIRMIKYNQMNLDILNIFHVNASTYYYVITESVGI
jgi:hypothetical protein